MAKEEKKNTFEITLADGTQLAGLEMNGNNFVSATEVTPETFAGKLGHVIISGDAEADEAGLIGEHNYMELIQIAHYTQETHGVKDGWYFAIRDIPAEKLAEAKIKGDIAYLAMMSDIDLD